MEPTPIWDQMVREHGDPFKADPIGWVGKHESQPVESPKMQAQPRKQAQQRQQPKRSNRRKR
jgi:hypothetical protein